MLARAPERWGGSGRSPARRLRALTASLATVLVVVVTAASVLGVSVLGASRAFAAVDGGRVLPIGAAQDFGSLSGQQLNQPVLGMSSSATGNGYWLVASDGGMFSFGDAPFLGSMGGQALNRPMIGMAPTVSGKGYWMFAGDGGVFAFGDAGFFGSTGSLALNQPIVGMTPTATGRGYWLVAADGGVFAFGDAGFLGSLGTTPPGSPIVALATLPTGNGYWVVTADGQVFPFGQAQQLGDLRDKKLSNPVVGMAATKTGQGYWLAQADGQVWRFGDAPAEVTGSPRCLDQPVVGLAARPQGDGLWLVTAPASGPVLDGLSALQQLDAEDADIQADLRRAQACQAAGDPGSLTWTNPLPGTSVTSAYGQRTHPVYRQPQFHRGVDLGAASGTAIRAAAAGTVLQVDTRVGYGVNVVVDHGAQLATLYAHVSKALVAVGDKVTAGQSIAQVGSTGFATGPHLHFEIRARGQVVNPSNYVSGLKSATVSGAPTS